MRNMFKVNNKDTRTTPGIMTWLSFKQRNEVYKKLPKQNSVLPTRTCITQATFCQDTFCIIQRAAFSGRYDLHIVIVTIEWKCN